MQVLPRGLCSSLALCLALRSPGNSIQATALACSICPGNIFAAKWRYGAAQKRYFSHRRTPNLALTPSSEDALDSGAKDTTLVRWNIRTVRHNKLGPEDYLDLSDSRAIAVDPRTPPPAPSTPGEDRSPQLPAIITYGVHRGGSRGFTPFPPNTRGFFYYHPRTLSPLGGALRFRLLDTANPAQWAAGRDLLGEYGTPWQFALLPALLMPRYTVLRDAFVRDRCVDLGRVAGAVERARRHWRMDAQTQVVSTAGEPFWVDLAQPRQRVFVPGGAKAIYPLYMCALFLTQPCLREEWPFLGGRLVCRLEMHPKTGAVSLRVVKIVEPVRMAENVPPNFPLVDLPLVPGKLLTVRGNVVELNSLGKTQELIEEVLRGRDMKWREIVAKSKKARVRKYMQQPVPDEREQ